MESAVTFLSTVSPCEYLPDRVWQLRYELVPHLRPADYMQRLQEGWRRFGYAMFRPECPSCRMCQSLRVPVATFRPNPSQRRAWKRNQGEVTVRVGAPSLSRDRLDLWARFHRHGHETKGWPAEAEGDPGMMLENPFRTEEWTYYVGNRLICRCLCGCPARSPLRDLLLLRPNGGGPFAGDVQHPVAPRLCSRAGAPACLPRLLRSGMSIKRIQAQVSPERSAPAHWNMGGVQRGDCSLNAVPAFGFLAVERVACMLLLWAPAVGLALPESWVPWATWEVPYVRLVLQAGLSQPEASPLLVVGRLF